MDTDFNISSLFAEFHEENGRGEQLHGTWTEVDGEEGFQIVRLRHQSVEKQVRSFNFNFFNFNLIKKLFFRAVKLKDYCLVGLNDVFSDKSGYHLFLKKLNLKK